MEQKIKIEEQKLKNLNTSYTSNTGAGILGIASMSDGARVELILQQVSFDYSTFRIAGQDNTDDDDKKTLIQVILNA